jgi:hypothetical protein
MAIQKSDGVDAVNNFPSKFISVYSTTAVAKGDVVMIDTSVNRALSQTSDAFGLSVKKATATDNLSTAVGIATQTITAADYVQIQYAGFCTLPTCEAGTGITVGKFVGSSAATQGAIQEFSDATAVTGAVAPFAFCVDAYTAGTNDGAIVILDKGFFNA